MASAAASGRKPAFRVEDDVPALPVENTGLLIVGVMAASLLQVLDTTIANVAIPHMQTALGATADTVTWVLTSYIIAAAVAMPITGWLSERIGARRLLIISISSFIAASMLCGMAMTISQMVAFRALQGVAGAFIVPLGQSFMLDSTRRSSHPQILALWGLGVMLGPILGPVIGGYLTENWNWRWVFYVNVPVGIIALLVLIATVPHRPQRPRRFDLVGFAFIAVCLTSIQLMLDRGQQVDWFESREIWLYATLIATSGWMFIIHMLTKREPLFEVGLFRDRNFMISLVFMVVLGVLIYATMALLPPLLQNLLGYDVIDTGMVMMPRGVGVLISMQLAGILLRKGADPRYLVALGLLIAAYSLWEMAHWSIAVAQYDIVYTGVVQGLGLGLMFIPLNSLAFSTLPSQFRTEGSSLLNLLRSTGSSVGISVATVLLARNIQTSHAEIGSNITANSSGLVDFSTIDRFQSFGEAALTMIDAEVNRQAAMIAYIDDFYLMMWLTLAAVPVALLVNSSRSPAGKPPPDAGH